MEAMTLTEFLTARLDERYAAAKAAYDRPSGYRILGTPETEDHFAWWKPLEVMVDIDAKRQVVKWCGERDRIYIGTISSDPDARKPEDFVPGDLSHLADSVVLRFLALPYVDHPDYDQDWKPTEGATP
jgi:hypothetical protein